MRSPGELGQYPLSPTKPVSLNHSLWHTQVIEGNVEGLGLHQHLHKVTTPVLHCVNFFVGGASSNTLIDYIGIFCDPLWYGPSSVVIGVMAATILYQNQLVLRRCLVTTEMKPFTMPTKFDSAGGRQGLSNLLMRGLMRLMRYGP